MKKILLIILLPLFLFSQEIITRQDGQKILLNSDGSWEYIYSDEIENTKWMIYENDEDQQTITFQSDGTFMYNKIISWSGGEGVFYNDDDETWKITKDNLVILSFNDGYKIMEGYLISNNNYMVGTYVSQHGSSGTWFGIKQDKPDTRFKRKQSNLSE